MIDLPPTDQQPYHLEESISREIFKNQFKQAGFVLGKIIKIPPKKNTNLTYQELPCPKKDQNKIIDLITTIGNHGKFDLLLNHKSRCEKLGDEVRYIHPYKFLSVIMKNPETKKAMKNIYEDFFKWHNFIGGIAPVLNNHKKMGTLNKYLNDFADDIHIHPNHLKPFIEAGNWKEFIHYIITH